MLRLATFCTVALLSTTVSGRAPLALPVVQPALIAQDASDVPSKEEVDEAVRELKSAFAQNEIDLRIAALTEYRVPTDKVVALQARALKDRDVRVRQAALEALRWTPHPDALRNLHKECKRNSALRKDETLGPLLFKAIGQHAHPDSIEYLRDKLFSIENRAILQARIFAIGNVRTIKALETLMSLMRSAKPGDVQKVARYMRVSLIQLTGVDRGDSIERWSEWWSENKRGFEIAEKPPLLPAELQRAWDSFWGIERRMPRGERREDRGGE